METCVFNRVPVALLLLLLLYVVEKVFFVVLLHTYSALCCNDWQN